MTDTSTILKNTYSGNGSATSFDYQFKILDTDELKVIKTDANGTDTELTLNTDYTITGLGNNGGGNVTYPITGTPLSNGEKITLYPSYSLTQTLDFTNQDKAYFELFEEGLDRANFKIKMLQEQISRSVKVGVTSASNPDTYLIDAASYAAQTSANAEDALSAATTAQSAATTATDAAASINVPSVLTGQSQRFLQVKSDETGYEFTSSAPAFTGQENTFTANQTINATLNTTKLQLDGNDITPHLAQGECRLEYDTATNVTLKRHNGKSLMLWDGADKWTPCPIPQAGIDFTLTSALSANTLYYLYAYLDNGTITLSASTSVPEQDSITGYMVIPTTDKYLCVGMMYTNSTKQIDDEHMVSSYFNRKHKTNRGELSGNATTTSTDYIEASTDLRCGFLIWDDEEGLAQLNAMQYIAAGGIIAQLFMTIDGHTTSDRFGGLYQDINDNYASPDMVSISETIKGVAQGYHYITLAYATSHASYAVTLHGTSGRVSNLNITVMG